MNARIAAVVFGAASMLDAGSAEACSFAGLDPHVVDTTIEDSVLPEPPTDVSVLVTRGRGPQSEGCGSSTASSCDDLGLIQLQLNEPATDNQTATEKIGYLLEVVEDRPPGGLSLPADAVRATNGTSLTFAWPDDDTDGQEIIAFSIILTPVDEAGNVGPSSDPIRVYDPGSTEGCATARPAASLDAALLLMTLAGFGRAFRRRRSD